MNPVGAAIVLVVLSAIAGEGDSSDLRPACCTQQDVDILDRRTVQKWPSGVIPYKFSRNLPVAVHSKLLGAMRSLEEEYCVIFIPKDNKNDYAFFEFGERCCSSNGYRDSGEQQVMLSSSCTKSELDNLMALLSGEQNGLTLDESFRGGQTGVKHINSCHEKCGSYQTLDPESNIVEQYLQSPGYPSGYPAHLDCVWKLTAPKGYVLQVNFRDLSIEPHSRCIHDNITVQYLDETGTLLRSLLLCGSPDLQSLNEPTDVDNSINSVVVQFHTDSSYSGKGLRLGYYLREEMMNITDPCSINNGGCIDMCISDSLGNHVCSCRPGYRLTRKGRCLDINECKVDNGGCNGRCKNTPGSYLCDCRLGYSLDWAQKTCKACDFNINQTSGTIYSAGYPISYPHNQNCQWTVHRWSDHYLKITIENFDVFETEKCNEDFLKIVPSNFPNQGRLCGYYRKIEYYIIRDLYLRFRTRRNNDQHSGFVVTYQQVKLEQLKSTDLEYVFINDQPVEILTKVWRS